MQTVENREKTKDKNMKLWQFQCCKCELYCKFTCFWGQKTAFLKGHRGKNGQKTGVKRGFLRCFLTKNAHFFAFFDRF